MKNASLHLNLTCPKCETTIGLAITNTNTKYFYAGFTMQCVCGQLVTHNAYAKSNKPEETPQKIEVKAGVR